MILYRGEIDSVNSKTPKVSLGLPVNNGEKYLSQTLDSLLGQTFDDFELIISDNGSTDLTPQICQYYSKRDKRIHYYRYEQNLGAAWNFNNAFKLSHGMYFKWVAHDDIISPTFLKKCVDILDSHPEVVWCFSISRHIDPEGKSIDSELAGVVSYANRDSNNSLLKSQMRPTRESSKVFERFGAILLGSGGNLDVFGLIRADAMRKTMLQLPYYGADKVFVAELSLLGRYKEIPEILFSTRVHHAGSGAKTNSKQLQDWIDPTSRRVFHLTRFNLLKGYLKAIMRAKLSISDRMNCFLVIIRYLFQVRKWKNVVSRTFRRIGTGGGYIQAVEMLNKNSDEYDYCKSTIESRFDSLKIIHSTLGEKL